MEKFLANSAKFYKHPRVILLIALVITVFFGLAIPKIRFDNSIRSMIPSDNHALRMDDYYEDEDRFGKSSMIFVGIESQNAFSVDSLKYVRQLKNEVADLNKTLPAIQLASLLGLTKDEAQKIVDASRAQGINSQTVVETFIPQLSDPAKSAKDLGWDPALAAKVAASLKKIDAQKFYKHLEDPVKKTQSLVDADYIVNRDDALVSEKMIPEDQEITADVAQALKKKAESWSIYKNALYSQDGTIASLIVQLNGDDADVQVGLVDAIKKILASHASNGFKTYLDGEPVISSAMGTTMKGDLLVLMPLVVLVVLLVLFLCFRNIQGVLYPMIVVLMGCVSSMGAMAWLGIPISIASVTLPPLMVAIASAYGIHQVNHYLLDPESDKMKVLSHNLRVVGLAVTLSGITVMVGFGALAAEDFVPIRNFGIFTAFGDLIAVGAALWVMPALILMGKKPKTTTYHESSRGLIGGLLKIMVKLNRKLSLTSLIVSLVITAVFAVGIFFVKSELNNVSFFKTDAPVRIADDLLNQKLAGTQTVNIVFDSDPNPPVLGKDGKLEPVKSDKEPLAITNPAVLSRIESFTQDVLKEFPYAGKVMSFNDIIKKMNQEMNGGDPKFYTVPTDANLISQYLLIFSGDIQSVVSSNHDKLRVSITLKRVGTEESEAVAHYARWYFGDPAFKDSKQFKNGSFGADFQKSNNLHVEVTGVAHLYYVGNSLLMDGMIKSIVICVILVFLLLLYLLRSLWMTLIAMIPIAMTLVINFGFLGLFNIPLNTATAMVSSIAIGIGVDYSIHYITWYRSELHKNPDIHHALENSIMHKGRAILYNMFVIVAGFLVLVVSNFVPLIQFGFLVAICMLTTAFGALIVVPAVIKLLAHFHLPFLLLDSRPKTKK